jgi:hypothetical protein
MVFLSADLLCDQPPVDSGKVESSPLGVALAAHGLSNDEIADAMVLSPATERPGQPARSRSAPLKRG